MKVGEKNQLALPLGQIPQCCDYQRLLPLKCCEIQQFTCEGEHNENFRFRRGGNGVAPGDPPGFLGGPPIPKCSSGFAEPEWKPPPEVLSA